MHHAPRRRRPRRPSPATARRTISRIAQCAALEIDRVSLERVGLLIEDGSPGALIAAIWESEALAERAESIGQVPSDTGEIVLVFRGVR